MIHHTLPHIPFLPESEWSDVKARLTMTVHCEYPSWIEFLTHHINVHVPHHVATNIPSYRLRQAWQSLQETYGPYVQETTFSLEVLKDVITNCHLYDTDDTYTSFYSDKTREFQAKRGQSTKSD
jgi:omega-6 fatty acid desaturase (delta-12 desaturase)